MSDVYNWKRFWCSREGRINLSDGGYLFDPDSEWRHLYNPDVVPFDSIAEIPCLALLGEPGIGKSFAIKSERSAVEAKVEAEGGRILSLDLRSYGSEDRVVRELFGSETFVSWVAGNYQLHIFLDSLDECLLRIETLATILVDELTKYQVERLRLRVACRTADWPIILESGLRKLWPDEAFKAYELSPLRRVDVKLAATANGLESEAFLSEVDRKEVVPLAIKPVTLRFLLNTYKKTGGFPVTQKELYLEGCRLLCEEVNESRTSTGRIGKLSANVRLILAARIAAVTVFANRYAVYTGIDYEVAPKECVTIQELVGGVETIDGNEVEIAAGDVEEALSTGLFSSRGAELIGWAHQTYAEFLAAWYVFHHRLSTPQIKSLIVHPGDAQERLVPQLHECAAWLAGMLPEVFRMMVQRDPQVLFRSDVASADVNDQASLVAALLKLYDEEKLLDLDLDIRRLYYKLKHPTISDQLRPYIIDRSKGLLVRRVAIDIAEGCECHLLQDDLLAVALDQEEPLPVRINAAYAINRIGERETKEKLKPLAYGEAGDDPEDELKGCGLRAVWPNHITAEDLFILLADPKRPSLIGSYHMFIAGDIVGSLKPSDLPLALGWVEHSQNHSDWHVFDELEQAIVVNAWDNLDAVGVIPALAKAYLSRLKRHERALHIDVSDGEKRHRLVLAILPFLADLEMGYIWLISSNPPLLTSADLFWLIERLKVIESIEEQRVLATLIDRTVGYRDVDQIDAVVIASQKNSILAETVAWMLLPVELGSARAEQMKKTYLEQQQWQTGRNDPPILNPPPEKRIADLLDKCEAGDLSAWWQLNLQMTLEPHSQYYGDELTSDLTALPGWKSANTLTRSRIVECATKYIMGAGPEAEKWLGTNKTWRPAFAGYRAFRLLLETDDEFVSRIEPIVWAKWVPIIVAYPTGSEGEGRKKQRQLICAAYRQAPDEIIRAILAIIDQQNGEGNASIVDKAEECFDDKLADALLAKLRDPELTSVTIDSLLKLLLKRRVPEARSLAESLIALPLPGGEDDRAKAGVAASLLVTETDDAGWSVVWPALREDAEFAHQVISAIAHTDRGAGALGQRLTANQIAELYIWLVRQYPHAEDPQFEEAHSVGDRESIAYFRNAVLSVLKLRGTEPACVAITQIIDELPEIEWLKWVLMEAQQIVRRETWIPPSPADVIKRASYSRLVLSLHGIRTRGAWQKELTPEIFDAGLNYLPLDYGFFHVLKLLFPPSRRKQVEWFRDEYTRMRDRYSGETPSVIAHSFGTYLVASAMEMYPEIKFDRIIFCGSIVPQDFNWSRVIESRQVDGVLNECGERDIWVKAASWLIGDAGPSGAYGFSDLANGSVRERRHPRFRHSDYLYRLNYHDNWLPFLKGEEPQELDPASKSSVNLEFLSVKIGLLTLLILIVAWLVFRYF